MDSLVLYNYYQNKGFSIEESNFAVSALDELNSFFSKTDTSIEKCSVKHMQEYIGSLTEKGKNSQEILLALARAAYVSTNREVYIYFTKIVERESIVGNLKSHMKSTIGVEKTEALFNGLDLPPAGAPPEDVIPYTQKLMSRLQSELSEEECRSALTANAHGIPPEAFRVEAEKLKEMGDLRSYLDDFHRRSVKTLQEHADSGKVWFEQIITQTTVDFVKSHKEVMGGVLQGNKIYWTKIPYDMESWLNEQDPEMKRYYACHCPMAREVLKKKDESIPRAWCNCTSGYIQQRFNAIFGEEVQVDLLETVLDKEDRCRFSINVPEKFL